jgi:predicted small lipoprotein YifL
MRVLLIGVAAALLTAGCGQKGPLYLPDKKGSVVTAAPGGASPASSAPAAVQPAQPGAATQKKGDQDGSTQQPQQPH